ncbi:retinol dehydrogenase 12-like [Pectinophora gossypiella]|uniref:retinol dehydrogenase 12-like n=1 Tax=Pectinophora gossypiella TaxID=13191 RepID=UPI00214E2D93|nr:retinol dehydrogenase 12-like [Pectinophora gossypiella]
MDYLSGWCKSHRRLEGLTAIVTGCNTGIGKETVRDLYLRGARVIMACRDITRANEAKEDIEQTKSTDKRGILVVEKLDLSSLKSVRAFAAKMLAFESKINILVNNAGVMCCAEGKTEDGFETHIGTNHFGHALLTLLLLPRITASAPSRIVFVSSYLHMSFSGGDLDFDNINFEKTPYDPIKAYARSKAANVVYARVLAQKLKESGITDVTTYSLHPGVINTEIGRHFSDTVWNGATWAFRNIIYWFAKSPRCGAQTTIYCAVDDACADQSGLYYCDCAPSTPSKHTQDDGVGEKLWNLTIDSLKLKNYDPFGKVDPPKDLLVE